MIAGLPWSRDIQPTEEFDIKDSHLVESITEDPMSLQ